MEIRGYTNSSRELDSLAKESGLVLHHFRQFSSTPQNALDTIKFVLDNADGITTLAAFILGLVSRGWSVHLTINRESTLVRHIKITDTHEEVTEEIKKSLNISFIKK